MEKKDALEASKSSTYMYIVDEFTLRRGEPALLDLFCSHCNQYIGTYQKDGPGPLLRCYWDRIRAPKELCNLVEQPEETVPTTFKCPSCQTDLASKGLYQKEQRMAFFLVENSLTIEERDS